MQTIHDVEQFDVRKIREDKFWNIGETKELLMHRIHAYPAKFPAFLTPKIVSYLNQNGQKIKSIADIFCGCGTSALESRILGLDFLGFDINPVATLIAKAKSQVYCRNTLQEYYGMIISHASTAKFLTPNRILYHDRLNYWFSDTNIIRLYRLVRSINSSCPPGKYRNFFLTAFSNILKPCSKWLTKSIKPQIDPRKRPSDPYTAFATQFEIMKRANDELAILGSIGGSVQIHTRNVLKVNPKTPFADLIITSPPYVTSYEYADLHQLSTLWLGYVDDYRDLRKGTIGSEYGAVQVDDLKQLNSTGSVICSKLAKADKTKSRAVRKYFADMERTVDQTKKILKEDGHAAFVIGNTHYKDVFIDNAKFLSHCLLDSGYKELRITKRKISSKILTPYRDKYGQFSNNSGGKKVYSHEYLIIAKK